VTEPVKHNQTRADEGFVAGEQLAALGERRRFDDGSGTESGQQLKP
jgi:hypothetical protein